MKSYIGDQIRLSIYAVSHVQASGSIMYYEIAYPKWYIQSAIL